MKHHTVQNYLKIKHACKITEKTFSSGKLDGEVPHVSLLCYNECEIELFDY